MNIHIETDRLIIREMRPEDEAGMFAMDSDPEVHRYLGNKPYEDIKQSRENIAYILQQYKDHGVGRWTILLKDTNEFVGWTGFKRMTEMVNGHVNHLDFGYRHASKFWGQGLAYEAAQAALKYGIKTMGFKDIYAMTDVENKGSRRILEKLNFKLVEIFPYDGPSFWVQGLPVTWYELH